MTKQTKTHKALMSEINAFCLKTGISKTEFGRRAINNASFCNALVKGVDIRVSSLDTVRSYMVGVLAEIEGAKACT